MADPAEFDILFLQKAVIGEAHPVRGGHASDGPVSLYTQTLGEHAIVEVAAVPTAPVAEPRHGCSRREQHQNRAH